MTCLICGCVEGVDFTTKDIWIQGKCPICLGRLEKAKASGALVLPGYINGSARAARLKLLTEQGEKIRAEAQG